MEQPKAMLNEYFKMAEEYRDYIETNATNESVTNYVIACTASAAMYYFKSVIATYSEKYKDTVLQSDNLATILHYMSEVMDLSIPNELWVKATSLYCFYTALSRMTSDTFIATLEEVKMCSDNLEDCRKAVLQIIEGFS